MQYDKLGRFSVPVVIISRLPRVDLIDDSVNIGFKFTVMFMTILFFSIAHSLKNKSFLKFSLKHVQESL